MPQFGVGMGGDHLLKLQYLARCCTGGYTQTDVVVAHLPRGLIRRCPRSGWSTAVAPGRPTASRETEETEREQRSSPSLWARTMRTVSWAGPGTSLGQVEVIPNTSPTHSCCIVQECSHMHRSQVSETVQRASIALCTLVSYPDPFQRGKEGLAQI